MDYLLQLSFGRSTVITVCFYEECWAWFELEDLSEDLPENLNETKWNGQDLVQSLKLEEAIRIEYPLCIQD